MKSSTNSSKTLIYPLYALSEKNISLSNSKPITSSNILVYIPNSNNSSTGNNVTGQIIQQNVASHQTSANRGLIKHLIPESHPQTSTVHPKVKTSSFTLGIVKNSKSPSTQTKISEETQKSRAKTVLLTLPKAPHYDPVPSNLSLLYVPSKNSEDLKSSELCKVQRIETRPQQPIFKNEHFGFDSGTNASSILKSKCLKIFDNMSGTTASSTIQDKCPGIVIDNVPRTNPIGTSKDKGPKILSDMSENSASKNDNVSEPTAPFTLLDKYPGTTNLDELSPSEKSEYVEDDWNVSESIKDEIQDKGMNQLKRALNENYKTDPTPHKRARHGGPLFYDVSTNTLFDPNNDSDCNNCCRICMAEGNELINIFGPEGKFTKCAMKINKFLPIYVTEDDELSHWICNNCSDVLDKIYSLSVTCQHVNDYFENKQRLQEDETFEVFDEEIQQSSLKSPEHIEDSFDTPPNDNVEMPFNELLPFDIATQNTQRNDDDTTTPSRNSLRKKKKQTKHLCCKYCDKKLATTLHASNHYEKMHQKHLCRSCFDNFDSQTQLEEHINSVHAETSKNLFGCPHCVMSYLNRAGLKKHMTDEHDKKYVCIICFKSFDLETNYKNHLIVASHEQQCKVCGLYFEKRNSLEKHIKTFHKEIQIPDSYTCSLCNMEYFKLHLLKKHYLDLHNRFYCVPCNTSFESHDKINSHCLTTHDSPTSFCHHCEACNKYYDTGEGLRHHKRRKHQRNEFLCEICGQEFRDRVAIRRHVLVSHEKIQHHKPSRKKVICDFCGKRILYCTMTTHVKIHLGLRNVKCPQCPNRYCDIKLLKSHIDSVHNKIECKICCRWLSSYKYKRHIKEQHDVEWSFVCNYCQIYFNDEDAIQEHCNIQHPTENKPKFRMTSPYQCNICFVYLGNDLQLQRHVRELHSEKRTYYNVSCCYCGKNDFSNKLNYKYHMYKFHQVPFDYQCNQCEKSFTDQSSLDKHQRFHSKSRQHFCDICNRAFESLKLMKVHKRRVHFTMTDEVCPICNKKYKGRNSLGKHLRLHSGNKPFNCDLCNIGYPTKQGLMRHWKRHKENKPSSPSHITKSSE